MAWTTSGVSWRDEKEASSSRPNLFRYPGPKLLTKQKCKGKWAVQHYAGQGAHIGVRKESPSISGPSQRLYP